MKKFNILIVDSIVAKGHKKFNSASISMLNQISNIKILTVKNNQEYDLGEKVDFFPNYISKIKDNKIFYRLKQIFYTKYAISYFKKNEFDIIFFIAYETISMSISLLGETKVAKRTWLYEHKNIDEADKNFVKKISYQIINDHCTHIVFEKYMREYLRKYYGKRAYHISHPLFINAFPVQNANKSIVTIFSPSEGNDQEVSKKLIQFCKKKKIKLSIKNNDTFQSKYIDSRKFFTNYDLLMQDSLYIFLSNKFENRSSGVFYEALSYSKRIIAIESKFSLALKKMYPSLIYIIKSIDEIDSILCKNINIEATDDYNKFIKEHSNDKIKTQYLELINLSVKEENIL